MTKPDAMQTYCLEKLSRKKKYDKTNTAKGGKLTVPYKNIETMIGIRKRTNRKSTTGTQIRQHIDSDEPQ